jgi:hypothetical protein
MTPTRLGTMIGTLSLVLLTTGCGVPTQSAPEAHASLPRGGGNVMSPSPTGTDFPTATATQGLVEVFFVGDTGLIPVIRRDVDRTPEGVLRALLNGPTVTEQRSGLASLLNADDVASIRRLDDGSVVVSLTPAFDDLAAVEQRRAIGQVVLSLSESGAATAVNFERGGVALVLPDASGYPVTGRLTRDDVIDLVAPGHLTSVPSQP